MFQRIVPCVVLAAASALSATAANVVVCTPSSPPGGALQVAIDAAGEGDVLLLKNGSYQAFTITNKSLVLIAEVGATVTINGNVVVQNLDVSREVLMSGLRFRGNVSGPFGTGALNLSNDIGTVRVQDCDIRGGDDSGVGCLDLQKGMRVEGCADVALANCQVAGSQPVSLDHTIPFAGMTVSASSVLLSECSVLGTPGGVDTCDAGSGAATSGGDGMQVSANSQVWLNGGSLTGGACGPSFDFASKGGDGARVTNGSALHVLDATLSGGAAGGAGTSAGVPIVTATGGVQVLHPGPSRHLTGTTLVRAGNNRTFTFSGVPGDNVAVYTSGKGEWTYDLAANWIRLVATVPVARLLRFGFVPGSGSLTISVTTPAMAPGIQAAVAQMQSAQRDGSGMLFYGSPRFFVIVDPSF